jgi:PPIC-type PPIASE domain/SurA N-terminal domain
MRAESELGWKRRARRLPLLGLLGLLLAVMALAGCGANAASDPLLAAKVNGHGVTLAHYQQMLAVYRAANARSNLFSDWRTVNQRKDLGTTQQQALDYLINIELLREQLKQQHITVSQKDIDTARNTLKSQVEDDRKQLAQGPDPALQALVDAVTPDIIDLLSEQSAMQSAMLANGKAPSAHVRGIEAKDQQTARQLQQQAEGGTDFATLAKDNSQDQSTASQGGEIGTIYVGEISTDFDKAVFAPGAHPGKYVIEDIRGNFWLFEVTKVEPQALSTITDSQTQATALSAWLQEIVRPNASIEEYVTLG